MRGTSLLLAILAVAVVCVAAAVVVINAEPSVQTPEGYGEITYHLNGGSLDEGAITTYEQGKYAELPTPHKEGKYFSGWYYDSGLTTPVGAILSTFTGDIALYAGWIDELTGVQYSINGPGSTIFSSSTTVTYKYIAADSEGNCYVEKIVKQGRSSSSTRYWTDEISSSSSFQYIGNQEVTWKSQVYSCTLWESKSGERHWVYQNYLIVKAIVPQLLSSTTYSLQDHSTFVPDASMELSVVADVGAGVSGSLTTTIGARTELTATGDFNGWYLDGELVTKDRTLTVSRATPGQEYEVRTSEGYIEMDTLTINTEELGLSGTVTITTSTGASAQHAGGTIEFLKSGYYTIRDSKTPVANQVRVHLDLKYKITYVLNGGNLPADAPTYYSYGEYMDIPFATKEGYYFEGWYTDANCTVPFGAVLSSTTGDVTIYASWTEEVVGKGFTMAYEYVTGNFWTRTVTTGSYTWKYVSMDSDGNYYVATENRIDGGTVRNWGYWTDESSGEFSYQGNQTLIWQGNEYVCEVWMDTDGETQWIYRNFIPMKITTSVSGGTLTYVISEVFTFDPQTATDLDISADIGLEVSGTDNLKIGDKAQLTASGDKFYAWFVDGVLATEDRTLTIDRVTPGISYEARSTADVVVLDSKTIDTVSLGLVGDVTVTYENGEPVKYPAGKIVLEDPGYVLLVDSKEPVSQQIRAFVDAERTFTTTWKYDNETYTYTTTLKHSDVYAYSLNDKYESRAIYNKHEYVDRFFTVNDKYVQEIVEYLSAVKKEKNMGDKEFATFVMRFVESIEYLDDLKTRGQEEFFKYPAEYLWDGGGDCEDSSIMYATLMYALGYDSGVLLFRDHAMGMVYVGDDVSGNYYEIGGKKYVFVETTDAYYEQKTGGYQLGDSYGSSYTSKYVNYAYRVADAS